MNLGIDGQGGGGDGDFYNNSRSDSDGPTIGELMDQVSKGGDPEKGVWESIMSFFGNLFGGRKRNARITTVLPGAQVSRAVTVGEIIWYLEGYTEETIVGEEIITGVSLTGGLTLGALLMPTMIGEPEFDWTRNFDIPADIPITKTGEPQDPGNLYLYRNMRSVNGKPMIGEGLDKLGLRDRDVNNLSNSTMITPFFKNGLSVTVGYDNVIPSNVPDLSSGLVGLPVPNPSIPNYGQIRPAMPMSVGTFRTLIQSTAPAWQPVK